MKSINRLFLSVALLHAILVAADKGVASASAGACIPAQLPSPFQSFEEYCNALRRKPDSVFVNMFQEAQVPNSNTVFPLRGCSFGCVVGNSIRADFGASSDNGGSWSGKCFRDFNGSPLPSTVINIVHAPDGLYAAEAFPGKLSVEEKSWSIGLRRHKGSIWVLDYEGTEIEFDRDFEGYRDEMRQVSDAPGAVIGKVFLKPFSAPYNRFNPRPLESFHFMLFQVCDDDDGFPQYPFDRVL